jgi:hypothetical protein
MMTSVPPESSVIVRAPERPRSMARADGTQLRLSPRSTGAWLATLWFVSAAGLAAVAAAYALGRSREANADWLFWGGYLAILLPITVRLLSDSPSRLERVGLVTIAGLQLYLVKVLYSPFTFTFPDEFSHEFNVNQIGETKQLFGDNPLLPVTSSYPGLETVTQAVSSLTGLSAFGSGLLVVGAARLMIMLALFVLYEEVTGSHRVAGLAALLYTAHANFLFFNAQFKYESLALPLALVAIAAVTKWSAAEEAERRGWAFVAVVATAAVTVTHHLTSYALLGYFVAVTLLHGVIARSATDPHRPADDGADFATRWAELRAPRSLSPWPFAAFAFAAIAIWLLFVAGETRGYLLAIFDSALAAFVDTVQSRESRQLFTSAGGDRPPSWERIVGVGAVLIMIAALPIGLRVAWQSYRRNPHVVLLALAAFGFLGSYALRFAPGAWEVGNRASEFLFVGMALVLAFAAVALTRSRILRSASVVLFSIAAAIVFMGGVIAGWPHDYRLPKPYRVDARGAVIEPQGAAVADWATRYLGPGGRILGGDTNRRFLTARGASFSYREREGAAEHILRDNDFLQWVLERLFPARYVVFDRRTVEADNLRGYFFPSVGRSADAFYGPGAESKFDELRRSQRLVDTGDIHVYDLGNARVRRARAAIR